LDAKVSDFLKVSSSLVPIYCPFCAKERHLLCARTSLRVHYTLSLTDHNHL
jgi:hypothetical protein